jgi:hypothetical protein
LNGFGAMFRGQADQGGHGLRPINDASSLSKGCRMIVSRAKIEMLADKFSATNRCHGHRLRPKRFLNLGTHCACGTVGLQRLIGNSISSRILVDQGSPIRFSSSSAKMIAFAGGGGHRAEKYQILKRNASSVAARRNELTRQNLSPLIRRTR